ncbi:MAG: NIPSNAP family protein [Bryobacterales bacterium]|nr:NIPSNAP family protein [Bryobacterales bacterium]
MTRRKILSTATAAAGAAAQTQAQSPAARHYIVMRKLFLRNSADNQVAKLSEFLEKAALPAVQRSGAAAVGFFASQLAPDSPFFLALSSYPTLAAYEAAQAKLSADSAYQNALKAYNSAPGLRFMRYETTLLRGFAGFPNMAINVSPDAAKLNRLFELRTYESDDSSSLAEKIRMFNEGEISLFQKSGLDPVFFGETVFGQKQPNLTYMLGYDDWNARDANWKKFLSHPDWIKLRTTPGWSDAEIVSNISSMFLRALPFSPMR